MYFFLAVFNVIKHTSFVSIFNLATLKTDFVCLILLFLLKGVTKRGAVEGNMLYKCTAQNKFEKK